MPREGPEDRRKTPVIPSPDCLGGGTDGVRLRPQGGTGKLWTGTEESRSGRSPRTDGTKSLVMDTGGEFFFHTSVGVGGSQGLETPKPPFTTLIDFSNSQNGLLCLGDRVVSFRF